MLATGRGAGPARPRYLVRAITAGKENASIMRAVCEVAAQMAQRLGLGDAVGRALYESLERWDGKGEPRRLRGESIAFPARIAEPATQAVIFHRLGGTDAALAMVDRRSGGWFDPAVAEAFRTVGPKVLDRLDQEDPWLAVLAAEPEPVRQIPSGRLETVAEAFAMVDLKTPFTLGHSSGVGELATAAAERLRLPDLRTIRVAALLHDLGRTAVGAGVWDKPGPLSTTEWEQVRLHPYHTERILARSAVLEPLPGSPGCITSGRTAPATMVPRPPRFLSRLACWQSRTLIRR